MSFGACIQIIIPTSAAPHPSQLNYISHYPRLWEGHLYDLKANLYFW
jgi:hypothetical protein